MIALKRSLVMFCSCVLLALCSLGLTACGEDTAAEYNGGEITEEQVTEYIENMRVNYGYESDVDGWETFIKDRTWDSEGEYADKEGKGTVAELRKYVIETFIEEELIEAAIEEKEITVTDEELDAEVASQKAMLESFFGGGMAGTADSIIEMYYGMTNEEFIESCRTSLLQQKLRETITGEGEAEEGSEKATEEYDKLWQDYLDELYANAGVTITKCPTGLSYAPGVLREAQQAAVAETEDTQSTEDTESE